MKRSINKFNLNNYKNKKGKKSGNDDNNNNKNEQNIDNKINDTIQQDIEGVRVNNNYDVDSNQDNSYIKNSNKGELIDSSNFENLIRTDESKVIKGSINLLVNETVNSQKIEDETNKLDKKDDLEVMNLFEQSKEVLLTNSNSSSIQLSNEIKESKQDIKTGNWVEPDKKKDKNHRSKKQKKEPANPPPKDDSIKKSSSEGKKNLRKTESGDILRKDSNKSIDSDRFFIGRNNNSEEKKVDDDYFLDKKSYSEIIKMKKNKDKGGDNRNVLQLFISVIKNNSTIYYAFIDTKENDIFIRFSTLILCISFYICLNVFLVFNMDMVRLYTNYRSDCFSLYIFIPCLVSVPVIIIKKYMSMKDFYKPLDLEELKKNKKDLTELKHQFGLEISKCLKDKSFQKAAYIHGICGLFFLIFNCFLVTAFCGIYPNTVSKLALNTFVSIIGSCVLISLFYLLGVILRKMSIEKESEILYNISRLFNPLHLSCTDIQKMIFTNKKNENNKNNENKNLHDQPDDENKEK